MTRHELELWPEIYTDCLISCAQQIHWCVKHQQWAAAETLCVLQAQILGQLNAALKELNATSAHD